MILYKLNHMRRNFNQSAGSPAFYCSPDLETYELEDDICQMSSIGYYKDDSGNLGEPGEDLYPNTPLIF